MSKLSGSSRVVPLLEAPRWGSRTYHSVSSQPLGAHPKSLINKLAAHWQSFRNFVRTFAPTLLPPISKTLSTTKLRWSVEQKSLEIMLRCSNELVISNIAHDLQRLRGRGWEKKSERERHTHRDRNWDKDWWLHTIVGWQPNEEGKEWDDCCSITHWHLFAFRPTGIIHRMGALDLF